MNPREFVLACAALRSQLLETYKDPSGASEVATILSGLNLDETATATVHKALDTALTDAFYSMLLALDGAASLGPYQEQFTLRSEDGQDLTGQIEEHAYVVFHGTP